MELVPRLRHVRCIVEEVVLFVVCDLVNLGVDTHSYNQHFCRWQIGNRGFTCQSNLFEEGCERMVNSLMRTRKVCFLLIPTEEEPPQCHTIPYTFLVMLTQPRTPIISEWVDCQLCLPTLRSTYSRSWKSMMPTLQGTSPFIVISTVDLPPETWTGTTKIRRILRRREQYLW